LSLIIKTLILHSQKNNNLKKFKIKKVLLVAVAEMFVLASCKKDRSCDCTIAGETEKGVKYIKVTKEFMVNNVGCVSKEYTTSANKSVTETCVIN